jgi:hypothetical protein
MCLPVPAACRAENLRTTPVCYRTARGTSPDTPPPAAILDVDGTLVDTNYHHGIAWYRAFRRHEIVLSLWRIHRHIGMGGDQLIGSLCGEEVEERLG